MQNDLVTRAKMAAKSLPRNRQWWKYGVHAMFRKLTTEWGMKFFIFQGQRDETWTIQRKLARHGLAPQVGRKFSFRLHNTDFFGYITEIALVASDLQPDTEDYETFYYDDNKFHVEQAYRQLMGYYPSDTHDGNFGILRGKLVMIDFSLSTMEKYDFHMCHDVFVNG